MSQVQSRLASILLATALFVPVALHVMTQAAGIVA